MSTNRLKNFNEQLLAAASGNVDPGFFDAGLMEKAPSCMKGIKYDVYGNAYHDDGELIEMIRKDQRREFIENFIEENFAQDFQKFEDELN